jgi:hypothetical protein
MTAEKEQIKPWDPLNAFPAGRRFLWIVLTCFVCYTQGGPFLASFWPLDGEVVEFGRNWAAARAFLDGKPIYGDEQQLLQYYLAEGTYANRRILVEKFIHPPTEVLLALPFAGLDFENATLAWNFLSLLALALSVWFLALALRLSCSAWTALPIVTLLLIGVPLRDQLSQGRLTLVMLLLFTGIWMTARSGRWTWAGLLLGTAIAFRLSAAFLILYYLIRWQWKIAAVAWGWFMVLTLITLSVLGPQSYQDYFGEVFPASMQSLRTTYNASLAGFWEKLFDPGLELIWPLWQSPALAKVCTLVSCVLVVTVFAWVAYRARSTEECDQTFGLAVTTLLLASPRAMPHTFLLLVPSFALVWIRLPPSPLVRALFMLVVVFLWVYPIKLWVGFMNDGVLLHLAEPVQALSVLSLQTYALLGLYVFGVMAARRTRTGDDAGPTKVSA